MSVVGSRSLQLLSTQPLDDYPSPDSGPSNEYQPIPVIAPTPRRAIKRRASSESFREDYSPEPATPGGSRSKRAATPPRSTSRPPSRPPSRTERRFKCTYDGCDKAYFKPARLKEHELTHTGERPHVCPHCEQSYLRASHLTAHMRTHLPASAKGHVCSREGCGKTFWTATHLRRHEEMHDKAAEYPCEHCSQTFHKTKQLREHVAIAHMPAGTKPFVCTHEGCDASFAMKQHLKSHEKTHDVTRYTCSHPSHDGQAPSFPTWSALQSHLHTEHTAQCPYAECQGKSFGSAQRLKDHLKVHAQQEEDLAQASNSDTGAEESKIGPNGTGFGSGAEGLGRKRQLGTGEENLGGSSRGTKLARIVDGEAGKAWACEMDVCEKRFKTVSYSKAACIPSTYGEFQKLTIQKYGLKTHRKSAHRPEGERKEHICPHVGCDREYSHASGLRRHLSSHNATPVDSSDLQQPAATTATATSQIVQTLASTVLDGMQCAAAPIQIDDERRRHGCPAHIAAQTLEHGSREERCWARFWRVYDVRRHLAGYHGMDLAEAEVRELLSRDVEAF